MSQVKLREDVKREADGIPCEVDTCGGYADRVACTEEERKKDNCGRSYECCSRAFVCRVCKTRHVGMALAPEMNF